MASAELEVRAMPEDSVPPRVRKTLAEAT